MGRAYRPVEVAVNGSSEIAVALLDTGADETVISEKLAKRLKVALHGEFKARCASQTVLVGKYADVKIKEIHSQKVAEIQVGVSDIPFDTDDIDEGGLDVIIGVDFLQKTGLKVEV